MSPRLLALLCVLAAGAGFQGAVFFKGSPTRLGKEAAGQTPGQPSGGATPVAGAREGALPVSVAAQKRERPRSLREALGVREGNSPADTKLMMLEALNQLDAGALAQLLADAAESSNFFRTMSPDFEYGARRLSEIAPELAAELWLKHKGLLLGGEFLLRPWANRSPGAFAAWSLGLPQDAQRALGGVLKELARANPQQFAEIAPQLAQSPGAAAGARGAIETLLGKETPPKEGGGKIPEGAFAYAKGLPEGPLRSAAFVELAQKCDLKKLDLAAHPEMRDALAALASMEARNVAKKFLETADKLPRGALRESAFAAQISAAAEKDPKSAAKKVEALSGSADYPAAVRGFVEATASKDPVAAIEWALSIGPQGGQRMAALEKAAAEYFRKKPDDARKWAASAPLSDEEYFALTGFRR